MKFMFIMYSMNQKNNRVCISSDNLKHTSKLVTLKHQHNLPLVNPYRINFCIYIALCAYASSIPLFQMKHQQKMVGYLFIISSCRIVSPPSFLKKKGSGCLSLSQNAGGRGINEVDRW